MKTNLTKSTIVGIVGLILASLLCCVGIRALTELWDSGIERAAGKVSAEPTLNGLAEYITSEIQTGMSRYEVEQVLQMIAPIEVTLLYSLQDVGSGYGLTSCDEIKLKLTSFPGHIWRIKACYDARDELVMLDSADRDSFPALDIYAASNHEGELFKSP